MKNKLLFGFYQRMIIIEYYKNKKSFNTQPLCVSIFENLKARRELQQHLDKTVFFKLINYLAKYLNRIFF